jgi:DNA-binding NarL/FixJ family response regulator
LNGVESTSPCPINHHRPEAIQPRINLRHQNLVDLTALSSNFAPPLVATMALGIEASRRPSSDHEKSRSKNSSWKPLNRLTPTESAEIVLAYQDGESVASLSNRWDVNRCTIYEHLESSGVPRRKPTTKLSQAELAVAHQMYQSGLSTATVGAELGISAATVATHLKRAGYRIRPRRGWGDQVTTL